MTPPAIILLNGTSSSGKSTLGRALQRRIDPQPVLTGLDSFVFGLLPPAWHGDPRTCAAQILAAIAARRGPSAFERQRAGLA